MSTLSRCFICCGIGSKRALQIAGFLLSFGMLCHATESNAFKVIAFYTAKNDPAHISFVGEAHSWFREMGKVHGFHYDSTDNWSNMNPDFLAAYEVVIFLDTRPEDPWQRMAFENYMRAGGSWLGFHFAAFTMANSDYPDNWEWYQDVFLGCGEYRSNTWRPTTAVLKVEDQEHPVTRQLLSKLNSAPNEWYRWENDLRKNPDIRILLSIHPESFPLGTGPKPKEIWHSGYYPVVWTHAQYRMVYFNMGHNDMDYGNGIKRELSSTFSSDDQNTLILDALLWLGNKDRGE